MAFHRLFLSIVGVLGLALSVPAAPPPKSLVGDSDTPLMRRLAAPFRGRISGRPLRDACNSIAQSSQINFWLHPEINPSQLVGLDGNPATTWDALVKIADDVDVAIFPVAGVVVMGPNAWVNSFAARCFPIRRDDLIDVRWPMLTTPREAWELVTKKNRSLAAAEPPPASLPHDLWPAVQWTGIDRRVALALVDCRDRHRHPQSDDPETQASVIRGLATYPSGDWVNEAKRVDPQSSIKRSDAGRVRINGSIATHRAVRDAWIDALAQRERKRQADRGGANEEKRFSLRVRARAGEVLQHLANQGGIALQWSPAISQETRDTPVDLEAKDATLSELAQTIANQINVGLTVESNRWSLSPSP